MTSRSIAVPTAGFARTSRNAGVAKARPARMVPGLGLLIAATASVALWAAAGLAIRALFA